MREEIYSFCYQYCRNSVLPFKCGIPDISVSVTLSPVCRPCLVSSRTVTRAGESLWERDEEEEGEGGGGRGTKRRRE